MRIAAIIAVVAVTLTVWAKVGVTVAIVAAFGLVLVVAALIKDIDKRLLVAVAAGGLWLWAGLAVTAVILAVGGPVAYLISLRVKPWDRCHVCKGNPRSYGTLWNKAYSICPECGTSGRTPRWGNRTFRGGRTS